MSAKITQLSERIAITGLEEVPVAIDGSNARVKLSRIKTLVTKADVGLNNVDNTSDADKPVSTAQATALAEKANITHVHTPDQITGLQFVLDTKANSSHQHILSDIPDLAGVLDDKANVEHSHSAEDINGLTELLDQKANTVHSHELNQINGLETIVNGLQTQLHQKAAVAHLHSVNDISGLSEAIDTAVTNATGNLNETISSIVQTVLNDAVFNPYQINGFDDAVIGAMQSAGYPGLTAESLPGFDQRVLELIGDGGGGTNADFEIGELAW
jgi:Phage tail repeat like